MKIKVSTDCVTCTVVTEGGYEMKRSVWRAETQAPKFPELSGDVKTEVLIIGGGMAGVLCAHMLKERGVDCLLCEAHSVGSGTTGRTTAVLSAQHDILYSDLIEKRGKSIAKLYLKANIDAIKKYEKLAENIDCDFERRPSVIYSQSDGKKMLREVKALRGLGFNAGFITKMQLPIKIAGGVVFPNQAQFHPLKFLYGIAQPLNIFCNTAVKKIDGHRAYTDKAVITADKIIIAAHFPIINTHGMFFAKLYQKRSFVIAVENALTLDATYVDNKEGGLYFRSYKDLLIVGGGDRRTGKGCNFAPARRFIEKHFPDARIKYAWAAQDCISLDGVPYIGRYSKNLPYVYVASGFNEWGMTSSMVASELLCDMITGKKNPYEQVFDPSRSMLHPQLFANLSETAISLATPRGPRCTHMGCVLNYNKYEHSWDCPCHGSRFSEYGEVIDNPALSPLKPSP